MEEDNPVKKLTFQKSFWSRRKGRPKLRWICDFHVTVFCEISSSHGGEYDVQSCFLGYTAV
jgi:hypothetical protein